MTPEQIAAVKQGVEALEETTTFTGAWPNGRKAITALRHILADQALDKKAENARELGLDYAPEPITLRAGAGDCTDAERLCADLKEKEQRNGCPHTMLGTCSLNHDNTPVQWGCVMCGKEFIPKPHPSNQVAEPRNMVEQPPITAELNCVCGAVWEWKNRSWELEQPHKELSDHIAQATNGRMRIDPVTGDVGVGTPEQQPAGGPVAWDVFSKYGRIYFAIGNQSFPVDYTPED